MKALKYVLAVAALLAASLTTSARAQSCTPLIDDLVAHAALQNGYDNKVDFKLVGNKEDSAWAQYATGTLDYTPSKFNGFFLQPARFNGEARQFFSDRLWSEPQPPGSFGGPGHPFSPYATDKLRVSFNLNTWSGSYHYLTYTLLSWGNASATVEPKCDGNLMYARIGDQMVVLSFKKVSLSIPH